MFFETNNIFPSLKINKDFLTILIFIDNDKNQIFLQKIILSIKIGTTLKKYFLINYILIDEDLEDLKIINDNKENIENYKFDKIINKYDISNYIISIFFKKKRITYSV